MINKFDSLRYFVTAAETLHFRQTALKMSVSPQVITRVISELEQELGEKLFHRDTRNIKLTPFGEQILPKAQKLLADSDIIFNSRVKNDDISGVVRITLPPLPINSSILKELLSKLSAYPDLTIDWRPDSARLHLVEDQIDIGLRIGLEPDPHFVVREIGHIHERIVAAPQLIQQLGMPNDLDDLINNYPLSGFINDKTGKPWSWILNKQQHLYPKKLRFIASNAESELAAAISGRVVAMLPENYIHQNIKNGELIDLFPDLKTQSWVVYLYRQYQSIPSERVLLVFDLLTDILKKVYS